MPSENTVNCHIKDGINYSGFNLIQEGGGGGGTSGQVITYDEWLQLTPEEQNNGEYYIPDFPTGALTPGGGFDTEPKLGSIKPVTSDGIARAMRVDTNPIGTVLALMGLTAPYGYLICDGTTYQIEDYPELADYFADQFGSVNKFGGNGTTTFAVPDLRGEFLRGTGTNGHANQGSGANVGVHQDGTEHTNTYQWGSDFGIYMYKDVSNDYGALSQKWDSTVKAETHFAHIQASKSTQTGSPAIATSRPTNTSVNFIIKAVNSPASAQQQLDMHNRYSTEETWTGEYWIDGKKIYRKCIIVTSNFDTPFTISLDLDKLIKINGYREMTNNMTVTPIPYTGFADPSYVFTITGYFHVESNKFAPQIGSSILSSTTKLTWIFEYTKTT